MRIDNIPNILLLVIAISGSLLSLILLLREGFEFQKMKSAGNFPVKISYKFSICKLILISIVLIFLLVLSIYFFARIDSEQFTNREKMELQKQIDSLISELTEIKNQQMLGMSVFQSRETERKKSAKFESDSIERVFQYRVDTVLIVVRDTTVDKKLKEKLARAQMEKFELSKTIDSLKMRIAILEGK